MLIWGKSDIFMVFSFAFMQIAYLFMYLILFSFYNIHVSLLFSSYKVSFILCHYKSCLKFLDFFFDIRFQSSLSSIRFLWNFDNNLIEFADQFRGNVSLYNIPFMNMVLLYFEFFKFLDKVIQDMLV